MLETDLVRLRHMLDACQEALCFAQDRSRSDLDEDRMLTLSLVHLLEIIGEAGKGVSVSYRENNQQIPWRKIIGMRDRLIHGYFDINLDVVWETITHDLPELEILLNSMLP